MDGPPNRHEAHLSGVKVLVSVAGVALMLLAGLTAAGVAPGGLLIAALEFAAVVVALSVLVEIRRLSRRAAPVAEASGTHVDSPRGLLMAPWRWVLFMTLVGGLGGFALSLGDAGLAVIGAVFGAVVGLVSVLMPLDSMTPRRRR